MKKFILNLIYIFEFNKGYPFCLIIFSFLLDQIIRRLFDIDIFLIYPLILSILILVNFRYFRLDSKIILLFSTLYLLLYTYEFSNIRYLISILVSIFTFYLFYLFANLPFSSDYKIGFLIIRICIYLSFILLVCTYAGFIKFGFDYDNIIYGYDGIPEIPRERCTYTNCFNVFRSFFTNSNNFLGFLFFVNLFLTRFRDKLKTMFIFKISGIKFDIFYFDNLLIIIMASLSESRIFFLGLICLFVFNIIQVRKKFFSKKGIKFLLPILISSLIIFKNKFNIDLYLIDGILYLPKTLYERFPTFLNFEIPITVFGKGLGAAWSQSYQISREYFLQSLIIDFGILGLVIFSLILLKFFIDNYNFLYTKNIFWKEKFLSILGVIIFIIALLKASSDIRNIPLAMIFGFYYPNYLNLNRN